MKKENFIQALEIFMESDIIDTYKEADNYVEVYCSDCYGYEEIKTFYFDQNNILTTSKIEQLKGELKALKLQEEILENKIAEMSKN